MALGVTYCTSCTVCTVLYLMSLVCVRARERGRAFGVWNGVLFSCIRGSGLKRIVDRSACRPRRRGDVMEIDGSRAQATASKHRGHDGTEMEIPHVHEV